jgi:hypothetical protein
VEPIVAITRSRGEFLLALLEQGTVEAVGGLIGNIVQPEQQPGWWCQTAQDIELLYSSTQSLGTW